MPPDRFRNVAVVSGGWSVERDVSLLSGLAAAAGLREAGYTVREIDAGRDLSSRLVRERPDVVFNALHGQWGEDGCVQGLLEVAGLAYTHSGVLASALAMDKWRSKALLANAGIPVPDGVLASRSDAAKGDIMSPPYVVKPAAQGSSAGVMLVDGNGKHQLGKLMSGEWRFGEHVLLERYIPGRELTVTVKGDRALCVTEAVTAARFFDYEAKYEPGLSEHLTPAPVPEEITRRCLEMALCAHRSLGCRGISRADFRYDPSARGEQLFCLEVNTQPGLTSRSFVPEQAACAGISFSQLCAWMVENAVCPG